MLVILLILAALIVLSPLVIAPFVYRKEKSSMAILRFKQLNIGERFTTATVTSSKRPASPTPALAKPQCASKKATR